MIRLIYVSKSLTAFPPDLKSILETSHANNAAQGISGALCFLDGVYFQYLEGHTFPLENLYRRIAVDPRHTGAKLIERTAIKTRVFDRWSMALVTWNEQTSAIFKAMNPATDLRLYDIGASTAARTFEALSRSSNWMHV